MINGIKFSSQVTGVQALNLLPFSTDVDSTSPEYPSGSSAVQSGFNNEGAGSSGISGTVEGKQFHHSYIKSFKFTSSSNPFQSTTVLPIYTVELDQFISYQEPPPPNIIQRISDKATLSFFDVYVTFGSGNTGYVASAMRVLFYRQDPSTSTNPARYVCAPYTLFSSRSPAKTTPYSEVVTNLATPCLGIRGPSNEAYTMTGYANITTEGAQTTDPSDVTSPAYKPGSIDIVALLDNTFSDSSYVLTARGLILSNV